MFEFLKKLIKPKEEKQEEVIEQKRPPERWDNKLQKTVPIKKKK